jgi:hypothetical protein
MGQSHSAPHLALSVIRWPSSPSSLTNEIQALVKGKANEKLTDDHPRCAAGERSITEQEANDPMECIVTVWRLKY